MNKPVLSKVVDGAAIGMPAGIIIAWVVESMGVEVPAPVAAAFGSFLSAAIGYFMPERNADIGVRG